MILMISIVSRKFSAIHESPKKPVVREPLFVEEGGGEVGGKRDERGSYIDDPCMINSLIGI